MLKGNQLNWILLKSVFKNQLQLTTSQSRLIQKLRDEIIETWTYRNKDKIENRSRLKCFGCSTNTGFYDVSASMVCSRTRCSMEWEELGSLLKAVWKGVPRGRKRQLRRWTDPALYCTRLHVLKRQISTFLSTKTKIMISLRYNTFQKT